jgi:hypothetical protein
VIHLSCVDNQNKQMINNILLEKKNCFLNGYIFFKCCKQQIDYVTNLIDGMNRV